MEKQKLKIGIVIPTWKLETYRVFLTKNGFKFLALPGNSEGVTIIKLDSDKPEFLKSVLEAANLVCANLAESKPNVH